jgi:hypothetical protein
LFSQHYDHLDPILDADLPALFILFALVQASLFCLRLEGVELLLLERNLLAALLPERRFLFLAVELLAVDS